jgi:hypothetical protein
MSEKSHVEFLVSGDFDAANSRGYIEPGWYFWDEYGQYCYGPYRTKERCEEALKKYEPN